jgi:hypothetical protein
VVESGRIDAYALPAEKRVVAPRGSAARVAARAATRAELSHSRRVGMRTACIRLSVCDAAFRAGHAGRVPLPHASVPCDVDSCLVLVARAVPAREVAVLRCREEIHRVAIRGLCDMRLLEDVNQASELMLRDKRAVQCVSVAQRLLRRVDRCEQGAQRGFRRLEQYESALLVEHQTSRTHAEAPRISAVVTTPHGWRLWTETREQIVGLQVVAAESGQGSVRWARPMSRARRVGGTANA